MILPVKLFSLVSCKSFIEVNKYDGLIPYIEVEKTTLKEYKEINVEDYISKFESKEGFICFFYSLDCSYCHKLINNVINPYIKESKNIVYGLNVYKGNNYQELYKIEKYQPISNTYFSAKNSSISIIRPVLQIIDNGNVVAYEKGYNNKNKLMLEAYIKRSSD